MARFKGWQDFFGTYIGEYDGRNAKLEIGDLKGDYPGPMFHIVFTELERGEVYVGTHAEKGNHGHIMTNITLKLKGGNNTVSWPKLFLHTWNTDFISGISTWNGIEFGMSFRRG
jgi:hypothetical protein